MLLHHIHSELLLVHSLQVDLMAHGVRHCLALWLAEEQNERHVQSRYISAEVKPFPFFFVHPPGRSHRLPFTGLMQDCTFSPLDAGSAR